MKIVTFSAGNLAALFRVEAFAPVSGLNEREMLGAIRERYNFGTAPNMSSRAEIQQTGLVFDLGFFNAKDGEITIHNLSIHNDGVVVRTNRTEYAEAFFDDLTTWLIHEYSCRRVPTQSRYLSEIVVEFEQPIANALNNYNELTSLILSSVTENREAAAAALNSLSIEFVSGADAIPKFVIERREGTTIEDKRYFCSAPLTTEQHLKVLEAIERLLL